MFNRNVSNLTNKTKLANLVVEHLVKISIDAKLLKNRTNTKLFTDKVIVESKELGLIHITATTNINPTRISVYGNPNYRHLADKDYFVYGWNTDSGVSIYFLKKQHIENKSSLKVEDLITLSENYLTLLISKDGEYSIPIFADQFLNKRTVESSQRVTKAYYRSSVVRQKVLHRAQGVCEFCQKKGFESASGNIYLETHHIVSLSEGGGDTTDNIIALCPNDHRKAHFENNTELTIQNLLHIVKGKNEA